MKKAEFNPTPATHSNKSADTQLPERLSRGDSGTARQIRFTSGAAKSYPFTKTSAKTQRQRLVAYLDSNLWITQEDAVFCLGILNLPRRIRELKNAGYDIVRGQLWGDPPARTTAVYGIRRPVKQPVFKETGYRDMRKLFNTVLQRLSDEGIDIQADDTTEWEAVSILYFLEDMRRGF